MNRHHWPAALIVAAICLSITACEEIGLMPTTSAAPPAQDVDAIGAAEDNTDPPSSTTETTATTRQVDQTCGALSSTTISAPAAGKQSHLSYTQGVDVSTEGTIQSYDCGVRAGARLQASGNWIQFTGFNDGPLTGSGNRRTKLFYLNYRITSFTATEAATATGPRTGTLRVRFATGKLTPEITVTQALPEVAPVINSVTCRRLTPVAGSDCAAPYGGTLQLTANATDANDDTLTYSWGSSAGGTFFNQRGNTVTFAPPSYYGGHFPGKKSIRVTVTDSTSRTARDSLSWHLYDCSIKAVVIGAGSEFTPLDPAGSGRTGSMVFTKPLADHGESRDTHCKWLRSTSDFTAPSWIRLLSVRSSSGDTGYQYELSFRADVNTGLSRSGTITTRTGVPGWDGPQGVFQWGADDATPACGTPAIRALPTTAFKVGESYWGEGFTVAWPRMGTRGSPGSCTASGYSLLEQGRHSVCGYDDSTNPSDATIRTWCNGATRPDRASSANPVTVGAVHTVGGSNVAQLAEFIVREGASCTAPTLQATRASNGRDVHLHYGCNPTTPRPYGDNDFGAWGLTAVGLTFTRGSSTVTTSTLPTATESGDYPGTMKVTCATEASGMPVGGFTATATVTDSGTAKTAAVPGTSCVGTYTD